MGQTPGNYGLGMRQTPGNYGLGMRQTPDNYSLGMRLTTYLSFPSWGGLTSPGRGAVLGHNSQELHVVPSSSC